MSPAALAKGALRRLAERKQEPTPENFAKAYAEEAGQGAGVAPADAAGSDGKAWAALIERLARNLSRGGKQWTAARRKDSLQRVLDGSRSDPQRLLQRLQSLMGAWDSDHPGDPAATGIEDPPLPSAPGAPVAEDGAWRPLVADLESTLRIALGPREGEGEGEAAVLARELGRLAAAVAADGARPDHVAAIAQVCEAARRVLGQGHRLVEQLSGLCREMGEGLAAVAEDESWVRGQMARLAQTLGPEPSLRDLRAASALLADTRREQVALREQRRAAHEALKQLIADMLAEVGELGEQTGRFELATAAHAQAIASADSIEGLAGVVRALLADTRGVQEAVARTSERLQAERSRAGELQAQVLALEAELKRASEELTTDLLTQVANRRGLMQAFEAEAARAQREPALSAGLAVGLIDIDNFKKLNDTLGHAAGDVALKSLAAAVRERLRPVDHLARFGGEEFVVLLPGTEVQEAQAALTRLQRSLTEALFLHDGREVFVTFSAGVTAWRAGEALQPALERADAALYEAKRTGKNRTCAA
jgi:diguanylate cyclase